MKRKEIQNFTKRNKIRRNQGKTLIYKAKLGENRSKSWDKKRVFWNNGSL